MLLNNQAIITTNDEAWVIDWLMYKSYEFQRENSPHVEPKRWKKLYINAEVYEKIYLTRRKK